MGSDDLFKKRKECRRTRVSREKKMRAETWLFADDLQKEVNIPYGRIFAVFDKDSFKKGQFNNAIFHAQKKGYHVLWSNECIELWFLLHFMPLKSNIMRQEYFKKLSNILNCTYEKNDDHFSMLNTAENLKKEVHNAEELYKEFQSEGSFANMAPCTTVFELIYELESYLGIELK